MNSRTVNSRTVISPAVKDSNVATPNRPAAADVGADSAGDPYAPKSGNGGYGVIHYDLALDYRIRTNRLSAVATLTALSTQRLVRFSLDLVGLTVSAVTVDGSRALRFRQASGKLFITPARAIAADAEFTVVIRYAGYPSPRRSTWGDEGWEELADGVLVAAQPTGAPTWYPCNDHPSDKATYRTSIVLASSYRAVANGRLVSSASKSSRTEWIYESDEPMASYLATLQIGAYRERAFVDQSRVPQFAFIPADLGREFDSDFGPQPRMLALFEDLYGPYPFEQYSVVITDDELEIPLEAQGLSIFGRNHVDGDSGSERLIAHELAHSWFGNSLTASSWQHIWLHEGFACYSEWLWSEGSGGPKAARLAEQHWTRLAGLDQDFLIGDPGADLMFDDRLYKRGALTLHAVRCTLGDEKFFRMLKDWTAANRYGSVTTEQFTEHVSGYTRAHIGTLLDAWLFEEALPKLPKPR